MLYVSPEHLSGRVSARARGIRRRRKERSASYVRIHERYATLKHSTRFPTHQETVDNRMEPTRRTLLPSREHVRTVCRAFTVRTRENRSRRDQTLYRASRRLFEYIAHANTAPNYLSRLGRTKRPVTRLPDVRSACFCILKIDPDSSAHLTNLHVLLWNAPHLIFKVCAHFYPNGGDGNAHVSLHSRIHMEDERDVQNPL